MASNRRSPSSSVDSSSNDESAGAAIPNQKKPGRNPPPKASTPPKKRADPDDDEEEGGEGDEESYGDEESDSDDERSKEPPPSKSKPQIQQKPQQKPVPAPAKPAEPESDEDESSEEEEEEEGDEDKPPTAQHQAQAKPSDSPKPKKSPPATATATATASREEPQKKQQTDSSEPPSGPKQQLFHRLWGPDDIVATLQALMDYRAKKGALPSSTHDFEDFIAFVRGSLRIEVNMIQMSKKVHKIKKKFEATIARGKNGADPTFTKPHDQEVFELSKKIWGAQSSDMVKSSVDSDRSEGDNSDDELTTESLVRTTPETEGGKSSYSYFEEAVDVLVREHPQGPTMKRAFDLLNDSKARDLDEKFKKQRRAEIKQHLHRMDLVKEAAEALFDALG